MLDWNDLIKHEIVSKACSNGRCSRIQACNLFSSHSGRPWREKKELWMIFHKKLFIVSTVLTHEFPLRFFAAPRVLLVVKPFSKLKSRHEKQERQIKINQFCLNVLKKFWVSSFDRENRWESMLRLHQNFILILLPQLSQRAPTLNQYCFSSSPTLESIDFGKISNYPNKELRNIRELAAVLQC